MNLPVKQYTENDLEKARSRGKFVGWLQGGAAVVGAGILLNLLGWIPAVLVLGGVIYVLYRILAKPSKEEE